MIDIDSFKNINDVYGHDEGDIALKVLAETLEKSIGKNDSAFRFAGDEFMIIIESVKEETAEEKIKTIISNINKYNFISGKKYEIRISTGKVYFDGKENINLIGLYKSVDRELYKEKNMKSDKNNI